MTRECSNCGGKHEVKHVDANRWPGSSQQRNGEKPHLCIYCRSSFAGNAFFYPEHYGGSREPYRTMAAMFNLLEERLRGDKGE